jgi:integration host factor subunit alpha
VSILGLYIFVCELKFVHIGEINMALTKAELTDLLFENVGLNKREAKDVVESFYEELRVALQKGEGVKLSGFGNFQLRTKPQRPGRNPKTGEEIPISARRVVTFHASQKLKTMVEKNYHGKHDAK